MVSLKILHKAGEPPQIGYRGLSTILGAITLAIFGTQRFLSETGGQSLQEVPAYVLGGVLLIVGVSAFYTSVNGQDIRTAVLISLGPVGGFLVYLIGYHLVLPPSTDSPTWIIFLAFAGGLFMIGIIAHLCGSLARRVF